MVKVWEFDQRQIDVTTAQWRPLVHVEKGQECKFGGTDPGKEIREKVEANTEASTVTSQVKVPTMLIHDLEISIPAPTLTADEKQATSDKSNKNVIWHVVDLGSQCCLQMFKVKI